MQTGPTRSAEGLQPRRRRRDSWRPGTEELQMARRAREPTPRSGEKKPMPVLSYACWRTNKLSHGPANNQRYEQRNQTHGYHRRSDRTGQGPLRSSVGFGIRFPNSGSARRRPMDIGWLAGRRRLEKAMRAGGETSGPMAANGCSAAQAASRRVC